MCDDLKNMCGASRTEGRGDQPNGSADIRRDDDARPLAHSDILPTEMQARRRLPEQEPFWKVAARVQNSTRKAYRKLLPKGTPQLRTKLTYCGHMTICGHAKSG
ncbi:hypothetical protein F183_A28730 [Bryobacterales bacterium F-183]|nr:hypothetical protein F183_A28730 [Bryobacterales bacterium F-183]